MIGTDPVTFTEIRSTLSKTLTKDEMGQYGETIVKACTTPESMTSGGISTIS